MIIGITGEMASGKTTVAEILSSVGFEVIHADKVGHSIYEIEKPAYNSIIEYFGESILNEDKTINRKRLGEIVFKDPVKLKKLSQITHQDILREIELIIENYKHNDKPDIAIDAALLFVAQIDKLCDTVWFITDLPGRQIKRLMKRDGLTQAQAEQRLNIQKSVYNIESYKKHSNVVINNFETQEQLRSYILQLIEGEKNAVYIKKDIKTS
jgi:dephospho-CoA kinase